MTLPARQVRAVFDDHTITVYQAYGDAIADTALTAGTFVAPFRMNRMTWVKPSFLWMMYRCGWATKPGQERVLAIRLTRSGFEEALGEATLSHFTPDLDEHREVWRASVARSPVRVQWDPERTVRGDPLPHRSLQVGLSGSAVSRFVADWIVDIDDITGTLANRRRGLAPLPDEAPYPLPRSAADRIGATG